MDPHLVPDSSTEDTRFRRKFLTRDVTEINASDHHGQGANRLPLALAKKTLNLLHQNQWLILQVLASIISYVYIKEAYKTWQNSPVVISINNTKTHVWDIPFPAVTICSLPSINENYDLVGEMSRCFECDAERYPYNCSVSSGTCSFSEMAAISLAYNICVETVWSHLNISEDQWESFFDPTFGDITLKGDITPYMKQVLPRCRRIYHHQEHLDEYDDCQLLWQTLVMGLTDPLTDLPVCYTFNTLRVEDLYEDHVIPPVIDERVADYRSKVFLRNKLWTTDNMMDFADRQESLPIYGLDNLFIQFERVRSQNFHLCQGEIEVNPQIGFHNPGEVPMLENTKFYSFSFNKSIIFYITPKMMSAHINLVDYEPKVRNCYFSHEHKLSLFKFYTQKNCQLECKANCTLEKCGCVPYSLPREANGIIRNGESRLAAGMRRFGRDQSLSPTLFEPWGSVVPPRGSVVPPRGSVVPYRRSGTSAYLLDSKGQNYSVKMCNTIGWRCSLNIKTEKTLYYRAATKWIDKDTPQACICDCLPDCNSLSYDFAVGEVVDPEFVNYSNLKVLYEDVEFVSMVRYSVSSWAEFVAYSLGILGVFNGLCGVGMCKAVYSWTLRLLQHCAKLCKIQHICNKNNVKNTSELPTIKM